ncbi:glycoside hydrolase family 16 protein [Halenospora varia]|nr:glycoside hydrolase family 16 protein [Halenospora varia]
MKRCVTLCTVLCALTCSTAAISPANSYTLDSSFSGSTFFDNFMFESGTDPTHGFVNYRTSIDAFALGLASSPANGPVYMGVDSTTVLNPLSGPKRSSVRISSKKNWTHGLFITDIAHMPAAACGVWPAYWTLGPNWPTGGEIDILEGVNKNQVNLMSLHTSASCSINGAGQLGTINTANCDGSTNSNTGCGSAASTTNTYGDGFNAVGGGVYAMEWTSDFIRVWFFPRTSIPYDISSGTPNPTTWGTPQANFQGNCNIDTHFANHSIIFDTTFCGDWAGTVWSTEATCNSLAPTCDSYVAANPGAFVDAYWSINYVKVFTTSIPTSSISTSSSSSTRTSTLTTFKTTTTAKAISSSTKSSYSSESSNFKYELVESNDYVKYE